MTTDFVSRDMAIAAVVGWMMAWWLLGKLVADAKLWGMRTRHLRIAQFVMLVLAVGVFAWWIQEVYRR